MSGEDPGRGSETDAPAPAHAAPSTDRHHRLQWVVRLAIVAVALTGTWALAIPLRRPEPAPPGPPLGNILYVDVAGWYGRTPAEVAVRTPFALTLTGLPKGLPLAFGAWRGEDRPHDPAVDVWLHDPEVSLERTYRRGDGGLVWISVFGSRGTKSYHLFEHTPETCYPLGGWEIRQFEVVKVPRGPRPLPINYGVAQNGDQQLVFIHVYVWDSPSRDPERGVISLRITAPVRTTPEATMATLTSDFIAPLFPSTMSWRRF